MADNQTTEMNKIERVIERIKRRVRDFQLDDPRSIEEALSNPRKSMLVISELDFDAALRLALENARA